MARGIRRSCEGALVVVAVGLMGATSCSSEEPKTKPFEEQPSEPLSAAQIVGILSEVGRVEVEQGGLALVKAKDDAVREYAKKLIADHQSMEGRLTGLLGRMRLSAAESEIGAEERRYGQAKTQELKHFSGKDFDINYLDVQIYAHRRVIRLIDEALAAQSEDEELRKELQDIRANLREHEIQAMGLRRRFPPIEPGIDRRRGH